MATYGPAQTLIACVECYEFLQTLPITVIRYFSRWAANFSHVGSAFAQTTLTKAKRLLRTYKDRFLLSLGEKYTLQTPRCAVCTAPATLKQASQYPAGRNPAQTGGANAGLLATA